MRRWWLFPDTDLSTFSLYIVAYSLSISVSFVVWSGDKNHCRFFKLRDLIQGISYIGAGKHVKSSRGQGGNPESSDSRKLQSPSGLGASMGGGEIRRIQELLWELDHGRAAQQE